jgi:hypothetical protein
VGKRALHVLDLLFPAQAGPDPAARPDPGFSGRRENRARLKQALLHELWGEELGLAPDGGGLRLSLAPEVAARLEERRILSQDVRAVVGAAERTGRKFRSQLSGHWLAYRRAATVTFWVEYSVQGEQAVVHNAYSHRMEVLGGRT